MSESNPSQFKRFTDGNSATPPEFLSPQQRTLVDTPEVYGDSENGYHSVATWPAPYIRDALLVRHRPFIASLSLRHQPASPTSVRVGDNGDMPQWVITPLLQDSRKNPLQLPAPSYIVDGGLIRVPFPAVIGYQWRGRPSAADGNIFFEYTTYANERPASSDDLRDFSVTYFVADAQTINVPAYASTLTLNIASDLAVLTLGNVIRVAAPQGPVSLGDVSTVRVDFTAALTAMGVNYVQVKFGYGGGI